MCNITSSPYLWLLTYKHFACHNVMDVVRLSDSLPRMGNKLRNLAMNPIYEVTNGLLCWKSRESHKYSVWLLLRVQPCMWQFILNCRLKLKDHSFCGLSYDKSIASSKRVLHRVRNSASAVNLQYPFFSLRSSNNCCGGGVVVVFSFSFFVLFFFFFPSLLSFPLSFLQ